MADLKISVKFCGQRVSHTCYGDKTFTIGTMLKLPDLTIDDDRLPPIFAITQFIGGKLFYVKHFSWWLEESEKNESSLVNRENGVELREAVNGKLRFVFESKRDGLCVLELETV